MNRTIFQNVSPSTTSYNSEMRDRLLFGGGVSEKPDIRLCVPLSPSSWLWALLDKPLAPRHEEALDILDPPIERALEPPGSGNGFSGSSKKPGGGWATPIPRSRASSLSLNWLSSAWMRSVKNCTSST